MLCETVRHFVDERIVADIGDWYDRGDFPRSLQVKMGAIGLLDIAPRGLRLCGRLGVQ